MFLPKLAWSNFVHRKARAALTIAAVALSVSLVVSVTSGYASVEAAARVFIGQILGRKDFQVALADDPARGIDPAVLDALRADPAVRRAVGRIETGARVIGPNGAIQGRAADVFGVDPAADEAVIRQRDRILPGGRWFDDPAAAEAVIDPGLADRLAGPAGTVGVGDAIELPAPDGRRLKLTVVGVVRKPNIFAGGLSTVYVPIAALGAFAFPDDPGRLSEIEGEFEVGVDADAFLARTAESLVAADPRLRVKLTRDTREQIDRNLQGMRILSYLGGAVSMLAATFIVFSTLSMGVAERQRTLAMLRAVGATKGQVGRLVLLEGVLLGAAGAAVGVPLGFAWVHGLAWKYPAFFSAGVLLDPDGVAFAAGVTLLAAAAASLLPAVNAMRVDPLSAMAPQATVPSSRPPLLLTAVGLLLVAIDPLLMFGPVGAVLEPFGLADREREARFYGHFAIGLPGWMLGFFLLAPLFVWAIERVAARPVAWALRMPPDLLRQQLSGGGLWRAAGTAAALMVGLATLVVMQTQGNTALAGWKLPDKFPDVFVYTTSLSGLDPAAQRAVRDAPGVIADQTMPIAVFNPRLPDSALGVAGAAVFDQTMFIGIDPDKAFDLLELDFRQGDPVSAAAMLKKGRHLLVTEEFRRLKGYGVGDTFELVRGVFGQRVPYTIAGVVWSPGIDVMAGTFDLGDQALSQSAASVFGSLDDARRDFGVETARLMAVNLERGTDKKVVVAALQRQLGDLNLNVADVRQLKADITDGFRRLLLVASTVAWSAMAVASLGVTNTVMAGIRARRWQFGVLRSVGVTRSGLLRLVLAEAVLLGAVGGALGVAAGLSMAIDARQLSAITIGYAPPMAVPWSVVGLGVAAVMLVSVLASAWPALSVARASPLSLLQAGRASA